MRRVVPAVLRVLYRRCAEWCWLSMGVHRRCAEVVPAVHGGIHRRAEVVPAVHGRHTDAQRWCRLSMEGEHPDAQRWCRLSMRGAVPTRRGGAGCPWKRAVPMRRVLSLRAGTVVGCWCAYRPSVHGCRPVLPCMLIPPSLGYTSRSACSLRRHHLRRSAAQCPATPREAQHQEWCRAGSLACLSVINVLSSHR